jgi:hypothetical protein
MLENALKRIFPKWSPLTHSATLFAIYSEHACACLLHPHPIALAVGGVEVLTLAEAFQELFFCPILAQTKGVH